MSIESKDDKIIRIIIFTSLIFASIFANLEVQKIALTEGLMTLSLKWRIFQYASWLIPLILIFFFFQGNRIKPRIWKIPLVRKISAVVLFVAGLLVFGFLFRGAGGYQRFFTPYFIKFLLVWVGIASIYLSLSIVQGPRRSLYLFLYTLVVIGCAFVFIRLVVTIASTPFSLAWSEGSFIYLASTYFSKRIYGIETGIPYIMSTRHLLEGIPFLFGEFSIIFHRGWLVFLNIISVSLFAASAIKRFNVTKKWQVILFLWIILYVFQGVIYYNILLSATIVLWGFDKDHKAHSLIIVLIASLFGGMNRINWAFTPPLLAVIIYLLETEEDTSSSLEKLRFLVYPILLFVLGSLIGLVGLFGYYIAIGGYTFRTFLERMQADSLLSRLLPSDTFPLGVILASLLVTSCLWYFIFYQWKKTENKNKFNLTLVLLINLVLFIGSLLVSAKIGGGADLHNMDAYLVSVFITFAYLVFPVFQKNEVPPFFFTFGKKSLLIFIFLIPVIWQINYILPTRIRTYSQEVVYLNQLQTIIDHYHALDTRPVLFVTQRQLLTFDAIKNVKLVSQYELVDTFEMVMAENETYLNQFRAELKNKNYSLIIIDPQPKEIVYGRIFNEESNKWYAQVTQSLNKYYELVFEINLPGSPIQIYAARGLNTEKQH